MIPLLWAQVIFFQSGTVKAAVNPAKGGELASLQFRHRGQWRETLYRALDYSPADGWQGRGPWLWPATGRGDPLPFHGFAKDMPWRVEKQSADGITISLRDQPETRKVYPHGFRVTAAFKAGQSLTIRYTVTASAGNRSPMPFTAGNHITFRAPLVEGSDAASMTLESPSSIEYLKKDGAPTGESRSRSHAQPVRLGDFEEKSAVSLGGYAGDPYMVLRDPAGFGIRLSHRASTVPTGSVVLFNMWGSAREGYFSPEPWIGLQNAHQLDRGRVKLAPGESWTWDIVIEPHPGN
jgi:galactose mutarotase-like enzyme